MRILRAYKTKLRLNNKERGLLRQYAGTARFVYNWALADRIRRYEQGLSTNMYEQKRRFNTLKHEEFPWITDIAYAVTASAFENLDKAYQNFFRRVKTGSEKPGFPKFKSRHRGIGSFTLRGSIRIERDRIKLPCLGWLRLSEKGYLPTTKDIKILSATISEQVGRWFVSVQVEEDMPDPESTTGEILGVDLGLKTLAVFSDGKTFENPRSTTKYEKQLARLSRELARREKGSKNRGKTKAKIAKLHYKIAQAREHAQHQVSHYATAGAKPSRIVVENLNVAGMVKNRHLAKAISDAGFGTILRQIDYKANWNGVEPVVADRFFPSSKMCSACGEKRQHLELSERTFVCLSCGHTEDRDLNAAKNLAALGEPANGGGLLWS